MKIIPTKNQFRKTKIMVTAGPSTADKKTIQKLIDSGVNLFRINLSHGDPEDTRKWFKLISSCKSPYGGRPAILADLAGPKIRVKDVLDGFSLKKGQKVRISASESADDKTIQISKWVEFGGIRKGARILIDDGKVQLDVIRLISNTTLECVTVIPGPVLNRKGLNFPGVELNLDTLTPKDIRDLEIAVQEEADWIALSFTKSGSDYQVVKDKIQEFGGGDIPIMGKIERWEATQNIDDIIDNFDAVMVARGDLGGEIPSEQVPLIQKLITRKATEKGVPVVIATQLLESMITKPVPTRAEVSDIANAVLDGTDALLLTGETAVGDHPIEAVKVLSKVILETENSFDLQSLSKDGFKPGVAGAIGHATCWIADDLEIPVIVTMTHSGSTAQKISHYRSKSRVVALTPIEKTCRRLALIWGVTPIIVEHYETSDQIPVIASEILLKNKLLKEGEKFVVTGGVPVGKPGTTNYLTVLTLDR